MQFNLRRWNRTSKWTGLVRWNHIVISRRSRSGHFDCLDWVQWPGYILSLLLLSRKSESSFTRIEENEKRKLAELSISFSVIERKAYATKKKIFYWFSTFNFNLLNVFHFCSRALVCLRCVVFQLWYSRTFRVISFSFFFSRKPTVYHKLYESFENLFWIGENSTF